MLIITILAALVLCLSATAFAHEDLDLGIGIGIGIDRVELDTECRVQNFLKNVWGSDN